MHSGLPGRAGDEWHLVRDLDRMLPTLPEELHDIAVKLREMAKRNLGLTVSVSNMEGAYQWARRYEDVPQQQDLQMGPNTLSRAERPSAC
jgi:hypothetical protein